MAPKLEIISAIYTSILDVSASGEKGKDVTAEVRQMVDSDTQTLTFKAGISFNGLFGDPEPFHPKQLKVLYGVDGVTYVPVTFLEALNGKDRVVPDPEGKPAPAGAQGKTYATLQIVRASWGSKTAKVDVKQQVMSSLIDAEGKLSITRSTSLGSLLGDPAIGKSKELEIVYKVGQEERTLVVPEKRKDDIVVIGA